MEYETLRAYLVEEMCKVEYEEQQKCPQLEYEQEWSHYDVDSSDEDDFLFVAESELEWGESINEISFNTDADLFATDSEEEYSIGNDLLTDISLSPIRQIDGGTTLTSETPDKVV